MPPLRVLPGLCSVSIWGRSLRTCWSEETLCRSAGRWVCPFVATWSSSCPPRGHPPHPESSAAPPAGQTDGAGAASSQWSEWWRAWGRDTPFSTRERERGARQKERESNFTAPWPSHLTSHLNKSWLYNCFYYYYYKNIPANKATRIWESWTAHWWRKERQEMWA